MSTGALLTIRAVVQVKEGMRVYYDCPAMSGEDFQSDAFFKKYKGKTALVRGFPEKLIGPLDTKGRLPGVYIESGRINVQFEGEEKVHQNLNLVHFVLLDVGQTVVPETRLECQKARDLPYPIEFWPGDHVCKTDDLLQAPRFVDEVRIGNDGTPIYILGETAEAKQQREAEMEAEVSRRRERARSSGDMMMGMSFSSLDHPRTESCGGEELVLVMRGNVYHLYHNPSELSFISPEDEIRFWTKDGISKTVYGGNSHTSLWEWSLEEARAMVEQGTGDLVVASKQYERVRVVGRGGDFQVRKLHPCFAEHAERVRALSRSLAAPPAEEGDSSGKRLLDLLSG